MATNSTNRTRTNARTTITVTRPSNDGTAANRLDRIYTLNEVNAIIDAALDTNTMSAVRSYVSTVTPKSQRRAMRRAVIRTALKIGTETTPQSQSAFSLPGTVVSTVANINTATTTAVKTVVVAEAQEPGSYRPCHCDPNDGDWDKGW
jgi:hypothetical protein